MKKRGHFYFIITLVVLIAGISLLSFLDNKAEEKAESKTSNPVENEEDYINHFYDDYSVFAPVLPQELQFAGEKVPLEYFDVRESLDKEVVINTYWHSRTFLVIKKANRYFPVIEKILKEQGLPDDFKYLAVAESALENAVSPAKAVGFWQFLKGTANDYGLEVSDEVDERYHLEKSTIAACKFLKETYKSYGDWALVAAAYNMGRSGLNKQIKRQDIKNYYDLLLNKETARYLFRVLAYKVVMSEPGNYGFNFREEDLYPPIKTYEVKVDSSVNDFAAFAKKMGTNYKMLKYFNPWLREKKLSNPNKKAYYIKLPADGARRTLIATKEISDVDTSGQQKILK